MTSERNRAMNQRVDAYFVALPETIAENQGRKSSSTWISPTEEAEDEDIRRGSGSTSSSGARGEHVAEKASKVWQTAKRRSRDFTSFFR
jgi:hypothetical protein